MIIKRSFGRNDIRTGTEGLIMNDHIRKAVEEGRISRVRYDDYVLICEELKNVSKYSVLLISSAKYVKSFLSIRRRIPA